MATFQQQMNFVHLYRGGKMSTYKALIENGFDLSKLGSGYGETLGRGIYLTQSKQEALGYSADKKSIIEVPIEGLNAYKLERSFSVDSKNHRKQLKKITQLAKENGFNALESVCGLEVVIFEEFADLILWDLSEILVLNQPEP